jgi:MoxR-like ATPase
MLAESSSHQGKDDHGLKSVFFKIPSIVSCQFLIFVSCTCYRLTLLLGPPSSGKTTLLLALAGKLDPDLKVVICSCKFV